MAFSRCPVGQVLNEVFEARPVLLRMLGVGVLGDGLSIVDAHHGQVDEYPSPPFLGSGRLRGWGLKKNGKKNMLIVLSNGDNL